MVLEHFIPDIGDKLTQKAGLGRLQLKAPPGSEESWHHVKNDRMLFWTERREYPRGVDNSKTIRLRLLARTHHGSAEAELSEAERNLKKIQSGLRRTTKNAEKHARYQAQLSAAEVRVQKAQRAVLDTNNNMHIADQAQHHF